MKQRVSALLREKLGREVVLEKPRDRSFGHFATPIAFSLAKELRKETNNILHIEEGTLYPILRKLKKEGIVDTVRREVGGRIRNYNFITPEGIKIFNCCKLCNHNKSGL